MIREPQSWTPSELIYLFVDGEADDVQKSMLFSTLANDAGLQAEFSDALRINSAVRDAGQDEGPPKHVTAALFRKAGFAVAAGESSTGVAAVTVSSRLLSGLRGILIPLASAFVGATLALLFAPDILRQSGDGDRQAQAMNAPAPISNAVPDATIERTPSATSNHTDEVRPLSSAPRATSAASAATALRSIERTNDGSEASNAPVPRATDTDVKAAPIDDGSNRTEPAAAPAMREIELSAERPAPVEEIAPSVASNEEAYALLRSSAADLSAAFDPDDPRFALQIRGLAELEMFPHRSYNVGEPEAFENLAVAGFYHISRSHSIGIEIGREYHPLYVPSGTAGSPTVEDTTDGGVGGIGINGTGPGGGAGFTGALAGGGGNSRQSNFDQQTPAAIVGSVTTDAATSTTGYRLQPRTSWFGVAYQFRADPIDRLGLIRPYVQTMVGATQIGPIGKGAVGISWTPDSRVSFNLGLEGTAILYRNNNGWYTSRKLGVSYSAQVNF